jgi:mRNA interferase MazF
MTQDGINAEQRNILLIPFPYSDLTSSKKRPVLVLSNKEYNEHNQDIICCAITSNLRGYKYSVDVSNSDLEEGNLCYNSKVKPNRIFTLDQNKILKKLGRLNSTKYREVISNVNEMISLDSEENSEEPQTL